MTIARGGIAIGMLRDPENRIPIVITNDAIERLPDVIAHEMGHTYYLWHPHDPELGPPVYDAQRFWVAQNDYEQWVNTFMSYRDPPFWIDEGRYDRDTKTFLDLSAIGFAGTWRWNLFEQFRTNADPEIIVLRGEIFKNGTVVAEPWYRLPERTPELLPGSTGNYSIVLFDAENQVLSQIGFNASFTHLSDINGTLTQVETDSIPFMLSIPFVDGTSVIEIRDADENVQVNRNVSPNMPAVNVTSPNGGEILGGSPTHTITWEAYDLDEDPLTYLLAYSRDGGDTWIPITSNLTQNSYSWDTSVLQRGDSYRVKVLATDGVNTAEDASDSNFTILIHNIAVTDVWPCKTVVGQSYRMIANVTVANLGDFAETFNVTLHANETFIEQQAIVLTNGTVATATFTWNTTGFAYGNYTIWAYATPVEGETYTSDNTFGDGWVYVSIPGDINGDQYVNAKDAVILGGAFYPAGIYNPNADIDSDEYVNAKDAIILGTYFGQHWS